MNILRDKYLKTLFEWLSLTRQFASILEHCDFLNTDISQGSVATRLRHGVGIFKHEFVANLPLSL